MSLIVQKFGGSSVRDAERLLHVAEWIAETYRAGHDLIVVLSAQGDMTDELIARAAEICHRPSRREMDMLLSTGEQISVALCAMALERMGLPCVSLAAWQAGIQTNDVHGDACIEKIDSKRIRAELDQRRIVLVTGFQGVDPNGDITTLGRGGSDTSAVALAAAFQADLCQIYTDVEGVYTADPRIVPDARKLDEITYDEMLGLAAQGANVLHRRSVELAKKYHVNLEVLSSMEKRPGTKVRETSELQRNIAGVAKDTEIACITLTGGHLDPGRVFPALDQMYQRNLHMNVMLQTADWADDDAISFTVQKAETEDAQAILEQLRDLLSYDRIDIDKDIGKVSVVGAGLMKDCSIPAGMLAALYRENIPIRSMYLADLRASVLLRGQDVERATRAIHSAFFRDAEESENIST